MACWHPTSRTLSTGRSRRAFGTIFDLCTTLPAVFSSDHAVTAFWRCFVLWRSYRLDARHDGVNVQANGDEELGEVRRKGELGWNKQQKHQDIPERSISYMYAVYNIITDLFGFQGGRIGISLIWGFVKTICLRQRKNLDTVRSSGGCTGRFIEGLNQL